MHSNEIPSVSKFLNINKLEKIQRSFTKKIHGLNNIHYWDRLQQLHLFSLQRRRERYMIIYIWKATHGLVPDIGLTYAPTNNNDCIRLRLPKLHGPAQVQRLMENSLLYHGARLFNLLPVELRALTTPDRAPVTVDLFKRRLDKFLSRIPDEPGSNKGGRVRAADSNSILHQLPYIAPSI